MIKYIAFRLLWLLVTWFTITSLVFFVLEYAIWDFYPSPMNFFEFLSWVTQKYWLFLSQIVTEWNWGYTSGGIPHATLFNEAVPYTLKVICVTMVVSIIFGMVLGLLLAHLAGRKSDGLIQNILMIFAAVPNYIWAFIFIIIFGFLFSVLPWHWPRPNAVLPVRIGGYVIPVAALSFVPIARFAMLIRAETIESFQNGYVDLLKAKGLSKSQIMFRHLLKDGFYPILPVFATTFIFVLTSSFLIEQAYLIPGVSRILFDSLFEPFEDLHYFLVDVEISVLISAFYLALALLSVIFADFVMMLIDPRVRMHQKR